MKSVLLIVLALSLSMMTSCKQCKKEDPRARVVNNGTQSVSVQIQTSGGNTVNINNILSGTTSDYADYAEGTITFNVDIGNGGSTVSKQIIVDMTTCYEYDIIVDANDSLTSVPTERTEK